MTAAPVDRSSEHSCCLWLLVLVLAYAFVCFLALLMLTHVSALERRVLSQPMARDSRRRRVSLFGVTTVASRCLVSSEAIEANIRCSSAGDERRVVISAH